MGAEGLLKQNYDLEKQVKGLKREVGDAKRDLSEYLSEAASIVYENDLLRSIANVQPDQLSLQEFKLKEKVTSAKAVALQKQLEREVCDLEEERVQLKRRVRQMSELAAEKVSLLHDLQPEQMLQLEEIAASMRRGRLELPMTDETRALRKEKEELEKKLKEKDLQLADHVDRKVNELLQQTGTAKDLQVKVTLLEKENVQLRQMAEDLQKKILHGVEQASRTAAQQAVQAAASGQVPASLMEQFQLIQSQMQSQMQQVQSRLQQEASTAASASAAAAQQPSADLMEQFQQFQSQMQRQMQQGLHQAPLTAAALGASGAGYPTAVQQGLTSSGQFPADAGPMLLLQQHMGMNPTKVIELQLELDRKTKELEALLEQERQKVRKLEAEGDPAKIRQTLKAEHKRELAQLSEGASECVGSLQALLDKAGEQVKLLQQERDAVMEERRKAAEQHEEQMREAQQDISNLRRQVLQGAPAGGEGDGAARLTPASTMGGMLLEMTLEGSQFPDTPHGGGGGSSAAVQEHLEQRRQQMLLAEERLAAREQEMQRVAHEQAEELRHREQLLLQELQRREQTLIGEMQARDQERQRQFQAREEEFRRLLEHYAAEADQYKVACAAAVTAETKAESEARLKAAEAVIAQLQQQQEELRASEQLVVPSPVGAQPVLSASLRQSSDVHHRFQLEANVSLLQQENGQLRQENGHLQAELAAEKEKTNQSVLRKQQQNLRKQLVGKQEQLELMKKTIENLKDSHSTVSFPKPKDVQISGC